MSDLHALVHTAGETYASELFFAHESDFSTIIQAADDAQGTLSKLLARRLQEVYDPYVVMERIGALVPEDIKTKFAKDLVEVFNDGVKTRFEKMVDQAMVSPWLKADK